MAHPITTKVVTLTFIQDPESQIYLQKRANTGFMDGYYDVPSGKVEIGESITTSATREVFEETGIIVAEEDLECFYTYLNTTTTEIPFIGILFRAKKWRGTPENKEPEKCSEAGFFPLEQIANMKVTPMVQDGLARLALPHAIDVGYYKL